MFEVMVIALMTAMLICLYKITDFTQAILTELESNKDNEREVG